MHNKYYTSFTSIKVRKQDIYSVDNIKVYMKIGILLRFSTNFIVVW